MTVWLIRKLATLCARVGCDAAPADDHCLCIEHRDDHRRRNRESKRRQGGVG